MREIEEKYKEIAISLSDLHSEVFQYMFQHRKILTIKEIEKIFNLSYEESSKIKKELISNGYLFYSD
jgi:hypothetical protein